MKMYHLKEMCCFCLKKFHSNDTKFTDFEHLSCFLPNVSAVIELDEENKICETCNRTVEMICSFLEKCFKNMAVLQSYKAKLKEDTNDKHQAHGEIMSLPEIFSNSDIDEINFLSEKEIKKEVENGSDLEILSVNDEIKKEIEEAFVEKEYSSDTYEDVLEHSNQFLDTAENDMKAQKKNDSDFEAKSINVDEIKIEIEEADIKKECLGDIYEIMLECNNQSPNMRVAEELHVAIEHIPVEARLSIESLSTVTTEEKTSGSNEVNVSIDRDSKPATEQQVHESTNTYEYDLCTRGFTNESSLKSHDCIHKKYESDVSGAGLFEQKGHHSMMRTCTCDVCNKKYVKKKSYICNICKKTFARKSDLVSHERLHTGEKPYTCQVCKKSFARKDHLVIHDRIHTGDKPYSCQVCTKSFTDRSYLVRHKRLHTGEKPYSCRVCKKSFTRKDHLVSHEHIHTKSCTYKSYLVRHDRIHTRETFYSCEVCKKSFTKKSNLVQHERVHTGEKPYLCQICKKSFTNKSHLVRHVRIHTGEKPYSCQVCKESFTQKSNLVQHECVHTEEKPILFR